MDKIIEGQIGTAYDFWGQLYGDIYNDTPITMDERLEMRRDETIKSGLLFLFNYVKSYIGEYSHPDQQIQDFVREVLENTKKNFQEYIQALFDDIYSFGYSAGELVWKIEKDRVLLKDIVVLPTETVNFYFEDEEITGIRQYSILIPRSKIALFIKGRGIYGESAFDLLYRFWRFKKMIIKLWPVAMEKYALPPVVGKTGDPVNNAEKLSHLWSQGVISVNRDDDIKLLSTNSNMVPDFRDTINALNTWMYRGLMLPQLLSSLSDVGSYAAAQTHLDMFETNAKSIASWFSEAIIDEIIYPLIAYNFGEQETYGKFAFTDTLNADERQKLMNTFVAGINGGIIDPVNDNDWMRSLLRFPQEKV